MVFPIEVFSQNVSAIVVTGLFLYYLIGKDKLNKKTFELFQKQMEKFNKALIGHGEKDIAVHREITMALVKLTVAIERYLTEFKKGSKT